MKKLHKEMIWAAALGLGVVLVFLAMPAEASRDDDHDHDITIINEGDTNVENIFIESGISSSDLDAAFAGAMAASQIHCNTSSRKHQAGLGFGNKGSESALAGGYCHSIGNSPKYAQTLGGTAVLMEGGEVEYGVGYNIAW